MDISGSPMHVTFPVSHIESNLSPEGGSEVILPELSCLRVRS